MEEDGFGYISFKNNSDKTLESTLSFPQFEGLKFRKPERGKQFSVKVAPGQQKTVIARVDCQAESVGMQMKEQMKFV